jgi:hypothetical protein
MGNEKESADASLGMQVWRVVAGSFICLLAFAVLANAIDTVITTGADRWPPWLSIFRIATALLPLAAGFSLFLAAFGVSREVSLRRAFSRGWMWVLAMLAFFLMLVSSLGGGYMM